MVKSATLGIIINQWREDQQQMAKNVEQLQDESMQLTYDIFVAR